MSTVASALPVGLREEACARGRLGSGVAYLVAFAAAAVAAGLGRAVTTTYLPVLLNDVRNAPGLIGTVMLVNAAAGFAVPLFVGVWSDRSRRRIPFILGGSLVTALGLAAVALGSGSSYLVLAASGTVVYVGLNAVTTAHRALVPECFQPGGRPRATSAQELAMLIGGLAGIAAGGALAETAAWAPFALAAAVVPLLALPTLLSVSDRGATLSRERHSRPAGYYARAVARPGVLAFLVAQILWVLGYAAMPVFFVLYAESVLGLEAATASLWLVGFGLATAAAMLAAGRTRNPARQKPLLALGVALMGIGFVAVAISASLVVAGAAFLAAAVGFGLISTLGFPLFSALIPEGEEGGYTALYFSVRAISSAIALPAVGWAIAVTGSYRTMFVLGGAVTLAALLPLARVPGGAASGRRLVAVRPRSLRFLARFAGAVAGLYAAMLGGALLLSTTGLQGLDEGFFRAVNSLGPAPETVYWLLDPHTRNYIVLTIIAAGATLVRRPRRTLNALVFVTVSWLLALALLEAAAAVWDRPRPEEVLAPSEIVLNGHSWAALTLESFPSGHMAVTTALAVAAGLIAPRLRKPLWLYVAAVGFTRVLFGAHFPLDVLAGIALGYGSARAVFALFVETGVLERKPASASSSLRSRFPDCPPAASEKEGMPSPECSPLSLVEATSPAQ